MTIESVWVIFVLVGFWLFDPIPWVVVALTMFLSRQWFGPRGVFVLSVLLGGVAGPAVTTCLGGCKFYGVASLGIGVFVALADAAIAAFFVAGLFKLARRLMGPPPRAEIAASKASSASSLASRCGAFTNVSSASSRSRASQLTHVCRSSHER